MYLPQRRVMEMCIFVPSQFNLFLFLLWVLKFLYLAYSFIASSHLPNVSIVCSFVIVNNPTIGLFVISTVTSATIVVVSYVL